MILRHLARYALASSFLFAAACGKTQPQTSDTLVTDVGHTVVKRQSIGNCWIYAQATWLESLLLDQTGEEVDVSESYWTWWNWYDQIVGSNVTEIQTGGFWRTSANIILKHGWVLEGEFIASEAGMEMSGAQRAALDEINAALQPGGELHRRARRTPARVRKVLDRAFGAKMADAEAVARSADATIVGKNVLGQETTLAQALAGDAASKWNVARFPSVWGQNGVPSIQQEIARKELLVRVMRALNDKKPVVMSLMIDFNALDTADATFKKSLLEENGVGSQGGHMVVLEDYTVKDVPGIGELGEGELSPELKAAALLGKVTKLIAKNSWGKDRPDRGLTDGYTGFDADYLFSQLAWKNGDGSSSADVSYYTTLTDFVLPPGY
jgi:hypothetical protein